MNWSRILQAVGVVVLLIVVALFAVQAFPGFVGSDHALIVQSGSMEPAIGTGSIVFVSEVPPEQVEEGDVITYADDGGNLVTHRVVEKHVASESLRFVTKGDANDAADGEPVYRPDYLGQVQFSIPYVGYIVAFGQTRLGWFAMVLVPTILFVSNEIWMLYRHSQEDDVRENY